jgi:hypothetical protein
VDTFWSVAIWQQFGAAIDMLDDAARACPDKLWSARMWNDASTQAGFSEFWYVLFHTLFYLDLYLSGKEEGFTPPAPFTLDELDPAGRLPERVYTKVELSSYLAHGRRKCQATIESLTDETAAQPCSFHWLKMSIGELLLYNMRHVQEHAAQLNLFLGQEISSTNHWVSRAR